MSFEIAQVFGYAPNQAEGVLDGKPFFFRARHGSWTLEVFEGEEADCIMQGHGPRIGGEEPGWWTDESTRAFLTAILSAYDRPG